MLPSNKEIETKPKKKVFFVITEVKFLFEESY